MASKKSPAVKFGEQVGELFQLFNKADRKKLETAVRSQDFVAMCAALGVSQKELKRLLKKGAKLSEGFLKGPLKEAASAFKKSTKA